MTTSHRVRMKWMGRDIETLADLLDPAPSVVCIGINPSPVSVRLGHYYQGTLGQQFFRRLRAAGLLPEDRSGWEDDQAVSVGIGFTDIVKRPTSRADELDAAEFDYGKNLVMAKMEAVAPELVIFPFKKTAQTLLGRFDGNGFLDHRDLSGARLFVMPGPYARTTEVEVRLSDLRSWAEIHRR